MGYGFSVILNGLEGPLSYEWQDFCNVVSHQNVKAVPIKGKKRFQGVKPSNFNDADSHCYFRTSVQELPSLSIPVLG